MRLTFPNGEHDDVFFGVGGVAIGSSDDDDICLRHDGIEARHVELKVEQRGLLLHVPHPDYPVSVNGRRIYDLAFLRLGDEIHLAETCIHVTADPGNHREPPPPGDDEGHEDADAQGDVACAVVLRGYTGEWQGRVIGLRGRIRIGSDTGCDIVTPADEDSLQAQLTRAGHEVYLRADQGTSLLNGNPVRNAILEPGDQLQWGEHRFVLEAPNPPRPDSHRLSSTAVMQAVPDIQADAEGGSGSDDEVNPPSRAWVVAAILAAAALATLIAFMLRDTIGQ